LKLQILTRILRILVPKNSVSKYFPCFYKENQITQGYGKGIYFDSPNGVPVSSYASTKDWMGYIYQQKPLPTNFTRVPVSVLVIDPNANSITIGTAITNANGLFYYTWATLNVPGDYTV
jgi:hypothetical protein